MGNVSVLTKNSKENLFIFSKTTTHLGKQTRDEYFERFNKSSFKSNFFKENIKITWEALLTKNMKKRYLEYDLNIIEGELEFKNMLIHKFLDKQRYQN